MKDIHHHVKAAPASRDGLAPLRAPLTHYLRLLWGQAPPLHDIADALDTTRPFLSNLGLHLPRRQRSLRGALAERTYFAAAAHAAAHLAFPATPHSPGELKPIQRILVGLLEDARAEQQALRELPGLMRLWAPMHEARPEDGDEVRTLLARLARTLLDPACHDPHPWIAKARQLCKAGALRDSTSLRDAASVLGHDLGQMRLQFDPRAWVITPVYRDDNAHLWLPDAPEAEPPTAELPQGARQAEHAEHRQRRVQREADTLSALRERPAGDAQTPSPSVQTARPPSRYPEWDRLIGQHRPDWATVHEEDMTDLLHCLPQALPQQDWPPSVQRLLRATQTRHPVRRRAQREGDTLDLDAVIERSLARRLGDMAERGVHLQTRRHRHDLAVLLLLDLSHSISAPTADCPAGLLPMVRDAAWLLSLAIEAQGNRCAIHGFRSEGRHSVHYLPFKDFDEPLGPQVAARLSSCDGALSTRLGAALRHATTLACARRADHRLLIVLTDGEPHDIDIHDPRYLPEDARHAVMEAASRRVAVGGICLGGDTTDLPGHRRMTQVFGHRRHVHVAQLAHLPGALQALYERMAG